MSNTSLLINTLKAYAKKMTVAVSAIALSIFIWSGLAVTSNSVANAETITNLPFAVATSGIKDQAEGAVDKGIGTVKRATGDMTDNTTGEIKGAMQQGKGNLKQGVGSAKNKLDNAGDTLEDKSESLIDSVKDFFE